jgi:hypothetical protein
MTKEIKNIQTYQTFKGTHESGYKKIIFHFLFAVKHDLQRKARLVGGGHLTLPTMEGSYSSVFSLCNICICLVSLCNICICLVAYKLGDISFAYLEAYTKETFCFTVGPKFGGLLWDSGASWHQRFADTFHDLQFSPCLTDPYVLIKDCKHVCVYVDHIIHMSTNLRNSFKYSRINTATNLLV